MPRTQIFGHCTLSYECVALGSLSVSQVGPGAEWLTWSRARQALKSTPPRTAAASTRQIPRTYHPLSPNKLPDTWLSQVQGSYLELSSFELLRSPSHPVQHA